MPCTNLLSHTSMEAYFRERETDPDFQRKMAKKSKRNIKNKTNPPKRKAKPVKQPNFDTEDDNKENIDPITVENTARTTTSSTDISTDHNQPIAARKQRRRATLTRKQVTMDDYEDIANI
jgi:hypothetical protein